MAYMIMKENRMIAIVVCITSFSLKSQAIDRTMRSTEVYLNKVVKILRTI